MTRRMCVVAARCCTTSALTLLVFRQVISLIRRVLPSSATPSADAEAAGETLWDLSAAQEHVPLLLRNSLPRAAAAALLHDNPPPSGRLQEELLGCLANLAACGFAQALADDSVVLAVVGAGLCGSTDPAALAEACRCLRAAVSSGAACEAWREALHGTEGARERCVSLLGSALHAPAVRQAADLVSSLWLAGSSHERAALLEAGALPAALAALAALPRLGGGDAHAAADAAARCVEAIASDSAAVPGLAESLADGSLQAALLPLLAQAEASATLAASACIALASVMAALQEAAASGDDETTAVAATDAIVALLQALAADGDALAAAQSIADDSGWVVGGDAAAKEAATELLGVLRASTCDAPDG